MKANRIGMKIAVFCLTFLLSFLIVDCFIPSDAAEKIPVNPIVELESSPIEYISSKLPCGKFVGNLTRDKLAQAESSQGIRLPKAIKSSKNQRSEIDEKFQSLEKEFQQIEKIMKEDKGRTRESIHSLIHVKNCAEYNEPR